MLTALLLLAVAQTQPASPLGPVYSYPSLMTPVVPWGPAAFEFATSAGTGMGAACACTNPTGTLGETMTFSRASVAWCTKGHSWSGIQSGDLVQCASNQARVMPCGDGTGPAKLLNERLHSNNWQRCQEFDNLIWSKNGNGNPVNVPTVWADDAGAPNGATTADAVHFPRTTDVGAVSVLAQTTFTYGAMSVFAKAARPPDGGTAQPGRIYLYRTTTGATFFSQVVCDYNTTSWTRCMMTDGGAKGSADNEARIGVDTRDPFQSGQASQDVLLWQADDSNTFINSPSPVTTTGAAASQQPDAVSFANAMPAKSGFSFAISYMPTQPVNTTSENYLYYGSGGDRGGLYNTSGAPTTLSFERNGSVFATQTGIDGGYGAFRYTRVAGKFDGANGAAGVNGAFGTPAASTYTAAAKTLYIGNNAGTGATLGCLWDVCVDGDAGRCF